MRAGIMLRHFDQKDGGVRIYTRHLLPLLFSRAPQHQFVLMYQDPRFVGAYAGLANVEEKAIRIPQSILWDQVGVPWFAARHQLDLIFNPKFTVPLLCRAKKVFVLHGSEWFAIPEHFLWYDRLYLKCAVPIYVKVSDSIIAVSGAVKRDAVKFLGVQEQKIACIDNGYDSTAFRVIEDSARRREIAEKYDLPEKFILWVGQMESRKNIAGLLRAFARIKDAVPHDLVLVGAQRYAFPMAAGVEQDLELIEELGLAHRVHLPGWITHDDLPVVYCLASLFSFPSLHEGFGIPLLEAMACGCPIVTANTCAPPEVTGDAAYLVDPRNIDDCAKGMHIMLTDRQLRAAKIAAGLDRVKAFSWERCANAVLTLLERLVEERPGRSRYGSPWSRARQFVR